jgi:hypothetical protein
MLRTVFVFIIISVGVFYAAQGPFYALLFYLWNAYFRPEQWVWGGTISSLNLSVTIGIYLVATARLCGPCGANRAPVGVLCTTLVSLACESTSPGHGRIGSGSRRWSSQLSHRGARQRSRRRFRLAMLGLHYSVGFRVRQTGLTQLL